MGQAALQMVTSPRSRSMLTEMELSIKEYLICKKQEGLAAGTIGKYSEHLKRLAVWLAGRGVTAPNQLEKRILREWGASLHDVMGPATVRLAVASAKCWLRWLLAENLISDDLAEVLKSPKVKKKAQRTLGGDEIEKMMASCDLGTALGLRDAALMSLLTDSGLRASEVCRLKVEDLEWDVEVLPGVRVNRFPVLIKGGNILPGYFGQRTGDLIKQWLAVRKPLARGEKALFISLGGTRPFTSLTRHGLHNAIAERGEVAGVKGASPHTFRRALACLLASAGSSDRGIMELGRWADLTMVLLYTRGWAAGATYPQFSPLDYLANKKG
jgi:integrase/recombinase XerD